MTHGQARPRVAPRAGAWIETTAGNGGVVVLGCATAEGTMTEKRKLAAILAADVVGYSRLAGADDAGIEPATPPV